MMNGEKVVVVMPAYNAAKTLQQTYAEVIAQNVADLIIVVDDASHDETVAIAKTLPNVMVCVHACNRGYGANQKTCYQMALESGADIVVMIHPDYQYTPKLLPAMVSLVANGLYPCVIGSRILGRSAVRLGMPCWKYIAFNAGRKRVARRQALGISYGLPRVLHEAPAAVATRPQLGRFRVRQPDPGGNPVAGSHYR